jgi:hypothetical protein
VVSSTRKWSFFKSILGTHLLGFMHIQEAAKHWQGQPVTIAASCVGSTKTKADTRKIAESNGLTLP